MPRQKTFKKHKWISVEKRDELEKHPQREYFKFSRPSNGYCWWYMRTNS